MSKIKHYLNSTRLNLLINPSKLFPILFLIIFMPAVFLRFYNLDWDKQFVLNPDEAYNVAYPAARMTTNLHPTRLIYGSLPIYFSRALGETLFHLNSDHSWIEPDKLNTLARLFSAIFSTLTIIFTFLLTKKLFSNLTAILATFFVSFSAGLIQASHFSTTETAIGFAGLLVTLVCLRIIRSPFNFQTYLLSGLTLAFAAAIKISGLIFALPLLLSFLVKVNFKAFSSPKMKIYPLFQQFVFLLGAVFISCLVYFLLFPYSILDAKTFLETFTAERLVATGKISIFYTFQFQDTTPVIFQLTKIFNWTNSYPTTILAITGFILILVSSIKKRSLTLFILLLAPTIYFAYFATIFVKWTRYMVPVMPFVAIFASFTLTYLLQVSRKHKRLFILTIVFIAITLIYQLLHALSFTQVYFHLDTRLQAIRWVYQNLPSNSHLYLEDIYFAPDNEFASQNPILIAKTYPSSSYHNLDFLDSVFQTDQIDAWAKALSSSDYIIIASRRIYATRSRLPDKFPIITRFYSALFQDKLGYKRIQTFSQNPNILGLSFNSDNAEETFQVFDHPKVLILQNYSHFSSDKILEIIRNEDPHFSLP